MRVAAVQLTSTQDKEANLAAADALVRRAAAGGAGLVVLPEKWPLLAPGRAQADGAEGLDGPAVTWAREVARELGIDLVAGSLSEREPGAERPRNTSVHVGPDGEIAAVYRKVHLFDATVDGTRYGESDHEDAGDELVTSAAADGAGLGLSVCYDLRFPELFRVLALRGARVLVVPSAFTWATTLQHWEVLLRARAIENGCFVVAANQVGVHAPGLRSGGRSMIVDPWGIVLAQAADAPGVVTADLDLARQDEVRLQLGSLANRRPAAYAWPDREEART